MRPDSLRMGLAAAVMLVAVGGAFAQAPVAEKLEPSASWADRAEKAARRHVLANAAQLAGEIQRIAHPGGVKPELSNLDFSRHGDRLLARIGVAWSDARSPRSYAAWVYWEFGEQGHVRAQFVSHTSPDRIGAESAARVESLFREKIYPAIQRAASAGN